MLYFSSMDPEADQAKQKVQELLKEITLLVPAVKPKALPINPQINAPEWAEFEHKIWALGEEIRQIILNYPALRKNKVISEKLVAIATNSSAGRGRQSFILLLGYKAYAQYADRVCSQIDDKDVTGQVINSLYKMQSGQYTQQVKPYLSDPNTWIKNEAKRYIERYS